MHHHKALQRRVLIGTLVIAALALVIGVPLILLENERYELAQDLDLVPGKDAIQLSNEDSDALLIVVPLDANDPYNATKWLYRAQFIAWPNADGIELEHLETHERVQVPLATIEYTYNNGDGSIILMRGPLAETGEEASIMVEPSSMTVTQLDNADSVPDSPGDWETASWQKTDGLCTRVSENRRFVGCFTRAGGASYLAGDWQLDLQIYADYTTVHGLYRGQGFVPWVGYAENDTVVYLQNELGIVRIDVPQDILDEAPVGTPQTLPVATPAA